MLSTIAIESLKRRKTTAILTLLSITISISLLLCVDIIRTQVKTSFTRTVSGVILLLAHQVDSLIYSCHQCLI